MAEHTVTLARVDAVSRGYEDDNIAYAYWVKSGTPAIPSYLHFGFVNSPDQFRFSVTRSHTVVLEKRKEEYRMATSWEKVHG